MIARITSVAALVMALAVSAAAERLIFIRSIPAEHELPGERAVFIYAIGDNEAVRTFVDILVERANRVRSIPIVDATERGNHVVGDPPDEAMVRRIHREHPADVYLGVNRFSCEPTERSGDVSSYDYNGTRVKRRQVWVDAACSARVDVLDGAKLTRLFSFQVKGEGTSQRVSEVTDEDRKIAFDQAARFAALSASELMIPRQIRESIELDDTAPDFDASRPLIDSDRLLTLRKLWESSLRQNGSSAALHFNVGAVCEALGDTTSARAHYEAARRLSPGNPRYRAELVMFQRRSGTKK